MSKYYQLLLLGAAAIVCTGSLVALNLNKKEGRLSLPASTGPGANAIATSSSAEELASYDDTELGLRLRLPANWQWHGEGDYKWYGTLRFHSFAISSNGNELYFQGITTQQYADRAKAAMFTTRVGQVIGYVLIDGGGESSWPTAEVAFSIGSRAYLLTFFFHKPDDANSTLFQQHKFVGEYAEILRRIVSIPPP